MNRKRIQKLLKYIRLVHLFIPYHIQTHSHYVLKYFAGRSLKELVHRRRNAVYTDKDVTMVSKGVENADYIDKDVIWSPWALRIRSNFGHVQNKRSEDVAKSRRIKNSL